MYPYIAAAIIGGLFVNRRKPRTPTKRYVCFGPQSGNEYVVDHFPKAGIVVVNAKDDQKTSVTLSRAANGMHQYVSHKGHPHSVKVILSDFTRAAISEEASK